MAEAEDDLAPGGAEAYEALPRYAALQHAELSHMLRPRDHEPEARIHMAATSRIFRISSSYLTRRRRRPHTTKPDMRSRTPGVVGGACRM